MIEIVERAVRAREVRTGDRLVLTRGSRTQRQPSARSDRLVTQTQTVARSVFLFHPQRGHTTCDLDTPAKNLRRVRVEPPVEARSVVHTTVTSKSRQRPSEGREWRSR